MHAEAFILGLFLFEKTFQTVGCAPCAEAELTFGHCNSHKVREKVSLHSVKKLEIWSFLRHYVTKSAHLWLIACKNTKKLKNRKKNNEFFADFAIKKDFCTFAPDSKPTNI